MNLELASHLLRSGTIGREVVEAALLDAATRRVPFVLALCEREPGLVASLDDAISRLGGPSIRTVRPLPELCAELPAGMCSALFAVPVHRDPRTLAVDIAAVDPLDPHIPNEFSFHLGTKVRILRAPYMEVRNAIVALGGGQGVRRLPRRFKRSMSPVRVSSQGEEGVPAPRPKLPTLGGLGELERRADVGQRRYATSERPIPLVRPARAGRHSGPAVSSDPAASQQVAQAAEEPVLSLSRSKPREPAPAPPPRPSTGDYQRVERASSAAQVLELVRSALNRARTHFIIFSVKGSIFEGRAASSGIPAGRVRALHIPVTEPSVLKVAAESGEYLGWLPETPQHDALRALLPEGAREEVYVAPVMVSGRSALILLLAGSGNLAEARTWVNQLATVAGQALEEIVRSRKRSP